jgi:glycine cleavage system aminomethyltransferase T
MSNLEQAIRAAGGPLELMHSGRSGSFPFPIRAEFTNWRDEQESWRNTAALMDLSHHMTDLTVEGPDCYRLLAGRPPALNWTDFHAQTGGYVDRVEKRGTLIGVSTLCSYSSNVRGWISKK